MVCHRDTAAFVLPMSECKHTLLEWKNIARATWGASVSFFFDLTMIKSA